MSKLATTAVVVLSIALCLLHNVYQARAMNNEDEGAMEEMPVQRSRWRDFLSSFSSRCGISGDAPPRVPPVQQPPPSPPHDVVEIASPSRSPKNVVPVVPMHDNDYHHVDDYDDDDDTVQATASGPLDEYCFVVKEIRTSEFSNSAKYQQAVIFPFALNDGHDPSEYDVVNYEASNGPRTLHAVIYPMKNGNIEREEFVVMDYVYIIASSLPHGLLLYGAAEDGHNDADQGTWLERLYTFQQNTEVTCFDKCAQASDMHRAVFGKRQANIPWEHVGICTAAVYESPLKYSGRFQASAINGANVYRLCPLGKN